MGRVRGVLAMLTPLEIAAIVGSIVVIVLAVIGPMIAPFQPETAVSSERLMAPSTQHLLGTDQNGIDILSGLLAAPRVDVFVGLVATALSVAIGVPLGVIAGFMEAAERRGSRVVASGFLRVLDVVQAFPVFILALLLVAIRGASVANIIVAITFVSTPVFIRLVRGEVLSLSQRPFAEAARAVGNSERRLAFRHLLPNAMGPVVTQMSVTIGFAILLTAGLSFVGAGVQPPTPELGTMVAGGSKFMITGQWWPSVFPGLMLGIIIFCFAVVGDALGRLTDPEARRTRPRHASEADLSAANVEGLSPRAGSV